MAPAIKLALRDVWIWTISLFACVEKDLLEKPAKYKDFKFIFVVVYYVEHFSG